MKLPLTLIALSLTALLIGCGEPKADLSALKTHRSGGITFKYPKNWEVAEVSVAPDLHYLFVETPGNALVIFQFYPNELAGDLSEFAKMFSKDSSAETPLAKVGKSTFTAITEAGGYEWITERFNIELLGLSIPHQRRYGTKTIKGRRVFLIFQVASEDLAKSKPGFGVIKDSLRAQTQAPEVLTH